MDIRTTDHVKNATKMFFETQGLNQAVADYFGGQTVKQMLSEGYARYNSILEEAKSTAPEGVEELAAEVAQKLTMTEEAYEQDVFETFKEKIEDIFHPVTVYISIKDQLVQLFANQDDENLKHLVMSAMDEITEYITNRFCNIVRLLIEGIPMETAEEIADEAGDAEIIPIGIKIERVCDEETDDEDGNGEHQCCGECGGHCDCGGKCEETGHCQCEDGCKCGNHTEQ